VGGGAGPGGRGRCAGWGGKVLISVAGGGEGVMCWGLVLCLCVCWGGGVCWAGRCGMGGHCAGVGEGGGGVGCCQQQPGSAMTLGR
jgi:hypothetical protein